MFLRIICGGGGERAGREEGSKVEVYNILLLHGAYKIPCCCCIKVASFL